MTADEVVADNASSRPPGLTAARRLVGAYVVLSFLTVVALAILAAVAPQFVTIQAWFRAVIIAGTSVLTYAFARAAVRRRPRALVRLRIVVAVLLVATVPVLFLLPLPGWMVIEQTVCALLLLATAAIIFRRHDQRKAGTSDP